MDTVYQDYFPRRRFVNSHLLKELDLLYLRTFFKYICMLVCSREGASIIMHEVLLEKTTTQLSKCSFCSGTFACLWWTVSCVLNENIYRWSM